MRIAQVSPLYESVPPARYGGTERMVSWLTEELVDLGHDVTLFASGDSRTSARLEACCSASLRLNPPLGDPVGYHMKMFERVARAADDFDIIHFHLEHLHFPVSERYNLCQISTMHGRLDLPELVPVFRKYASMPIVSISQSQRRPLPCANWVGNVYHGLPERSLKFHPGAGKYLVFLGRIAREKRPDRAIEIATRAKLPLTIAAKVDPADKQYFEREIEPLLDNPFVDFIGEVAEPEKNALLGNAIACLMPIDWPEPFGINMIESMACGTPVIAYRHGSVPEIVTDGANGFIVESIEEAVEAVARIPSLSRAACRRIFEERFTSTRMASDYVRIYEAQIGARPCAPEIVLEEKLSYRNTDLSSGSL